MVNPFIVYILAFGGTLLAYGFDWSTLYPRLSGDVVSFFIWTFLAALPLAAVVWPRLACVRRRKSALPGWMTKAMVVGMIADIAYAGGIPLFMVAAGSDFDYSQFGIPTFHVILVTFSSAYAAVRFSDFLISRRTRYLVDALIPLAFSVLTFTRGTAMMSLIAFGFIWLSHHGMPRLRSMIVGVVLGIGALYAFGVLGDIRSPGAIEEVGQPSSAFKKSIVPTPYLWTYIYVTSPLANLQNTVDAGERPNGSAVQFAAAELVPDFIGKRILEAMDVPREDVARVAPTLNAASIYARAFSYMGWVGAAIMFFALAGVVGVFTWLLGGSSYAVPAIATLNTLVLLCIFENMLSFTGMVMQLFWLLVFAQFFPRSRVGEAGQDRHDDAGEQGHSARQQHGADQQGPGVTGDLRGSL
ncbi:oligosaccharide repeat unit polymerase [Ralstonia solanacearum]|uniref:O-antigen polymerase n=1 Tax=Ralstonia pseudosolanacearum TaxID=1310165 RepID=UPI0002F63F0F|nr:O-antigen polymerase [Ralstonia pseudosolanacearum]AOE89385.1 hypothetical protein LBM341_01090 [Ralstonia solanacearum]APF87312.1 hypothetical protein BCR16_11095 [Ralstonia solanacearum FJAT-1458]ARS55919.1 hypothetical protein BC427_07290 [Ralstonia solanacearum FJAT-91]ESS47504.1 hypothetical protein L665_03064 [Ralstonia solanacearum SD54]AXV69253.1 hypothetical protein CJO74_08165 [Ralstonia solanacearum]